MTKILLLDIENQSQKIKCLKELLIEYHRVILVFAQTNLTVPLDALLEYSRAIQEQRLSIVKMPKKGPNSADFGITFIAGRLSAELDQNTVIHVMSNDHAMSYAVDLLEGIGFKALQIKATLAVPKVEKNLIENIEEQKSKKQNAEVEKYTPDQDRLIQYCTRLLKANNRPATKKTLSNAIKSTLKFENPAQVEAVLKFFQKHKMISDQNGKLIYITENIEKWIKKKS